MGDADDAGAVGTARSREQSSGHHRVDELTLKRICRETLARHDAPNKRLAAVAAQGDQLRQNIFQRCLSRGESPPKVASQRCRKAPSTPPSLRYSANVNVPSWDRCSQSSSNKCSTRGSSSLCSVASRKITSESVCSPSRSNRRPARAPAR